jgi:UDP-2,3-diacylglucosamine pyrophosphatase LpxH
MNSEQTIFVISDLHLGDGTARDSFSNSRKCDLLFHFLDYVADKNGRLIILGDLCELYRFRLDTILEQWKHLFDRLHEMHPIYIPGNHDAAVGILDASHLPHPFFSHMQTPFTERIGDKQLYFMHGHELDPFIPKAQAGWGIINSILNKLFEYCSHSDACNNETISSFFLEAGEQLLRCWQGLGQMFSNMTHGSNPNLPGGRPHHFEKSIRLQKMASRVYKHRENESYDCAIVGHTHRAGTLDPWYFNSGSWTRQNSNYLQIRTDGHIDIHNW